MDGGPMDLDPMDLAPVFRPDGFRPDGFGPDGFDPADLYSWILAPVDLYPMGLDRWMETRWI